IVSAGEIVDVPVHIVDADHLIGLQYTMQVNGEYLNVLSIDPNDLLSVSADHFGLSRLKHGMYTTAYNTPEILTGVKTKFYTMQIEVLKSGKLSEMLSVNSRITIASAFLADGTRVPVALNFADTPGGSNMRLFQNEPNPAITDTRISFYLPGKTSAKLVFYTIDGKILREINGDYEPGLHTITMDAAALDETGVIYYELITDTDKIGRKMILH
ncbi:MAG: hypothetical protein HKN76_13755, partial [Saprospiraceae bacterium]|nr:hypothetical protein [Saprospiraceae bacterium]